MIHDQAEALAAAGIPQDHGNAFLKIAEKSRCIIMSRVPGRLAEGPISEGYASKGYHNKAKSCDWGPMAGFVCEVPIFSKQGLSTEGWEKQQKALGKAKKSGAKSIQLAVSRARITWLIDNGYVRYKKNAGTLADSIFQLVPTFKNVDTKQDNVADARQFSFRAVRGQVGDSSGNNIEIFNLFFQYPAAYQITPNQTGWLPLTAMVDWNWDPRKSGVAFDYQNLEQQAQQIKENYLDDIWVVDSSSPNGGKNIKAPKGSKAISVKTQSYALSGKIIPDYLKATTGDYDLFSVWSCKADKWTDQQGNASVNLDTHLAKSRDIKNAPPSLKSADSKKDFMSKSSARLKGLEMEDLGNMTPRLSVVRYLLNEAFRVEGYVGGDLVHHAAESGRPYIDDIDFPFVVFSPKDPLSQVLRKRCVLIENIKDFRNLIDAVETAYNVILNPAWIEQLSTGSQHSEDYYQKWVVR